MTTDHDLAQRYRWFCIVGWKESVLNDPRVIRGEATPDDIDKLIQEGMHRWPIKTIVIPPHPPKEAA